MKPIHELNIVLIVTGGIAAYKMPEFVRRIKEHGASVRVVMTNAANAFITPMTMQAVSGNPVSTELLDPTAEAAMGHIELAKWADLVVVAPASADFVARMANGHANDLASTILLATVAPVAICPAMNQAMFQHPAVQHNLATLTHRKVYVWGPASGEQACGDVGKGRMIEPHDIVRHVLELAVEPILKDITITITAGPTREAIDPVRYISNHSSGKMGYALAAAAQKLGATVNLISGPVALTTPNNCTRIDVNSAEEMHREALKFAQQSDIFIGCAAVADYRVADVATQKIKKNNEKISIELIKNPDIIQDVAKLKNKRPFVVGFAAETQDVERYAYDKLTRKNLDLICANDVSVSGLGFNSDQNAIKVIWQDGSKDLPATNKTQLAEQLMVLINQRYNNK